MDNSSESQNSTTKNSPIFPTVDFILESPLQIQGDPSQNFSNINFATTAPTYHIIPTGRVIDKIMGFQK